MRATDEDLERTVGARIQVGPQERAVTEIEFDGDPRITVEELLSWVEHFAGVEGPQLIEDSGKDGVDAVRNTLERLRDLVGSAIDQSRNA